MPTKVAYKQQFYWMFLRWWSNLIINLKHIFQNEVAQTKWNFNQLQRGSLNLYKNQTKEKIM